MGRASLILTVTRQCNLRCSYCPTAKDGWPSLSVDDGHKAVALFADRFGGGDIKLFGGEPLLVPEVVRAVIADAANRPQIRRVYLSTNGLGLDDTWLQLVREQPKLVLTISLDGRPADHRLHRRALPTVGDTYDHLTTLLPQLRRTPRVVVTQTIAPAAATAAHQNFNHLLSLGFTRFNLLPGYYLPWKPKQLAALRQGFSRIAQTIEEHWQRGQHLYLRNLFTWAPTPFFNTGLVVDSDRTIHPSNVGLSSNLASLLDHTRLGDLDAPPSPQELKAKAKHINQLLQTTLSDHVWQSTLAVDEELSRLCRGLYPSFLRYRKQRAA